MQAVGESTAVHPHNGKDHGMGWPQLCNPCRRLGTQPPCRRPASTHLYSCPDLRPTQPPCRRLGTQPPCTQPPCRRPASTPLQTCGLHNPPAGDYMPVCVCVCVACQHSPVILPVPVDGHLLSQGHQSVRVVLRHPALAHGDEGVLLGAVADAL